MGADLLVVGMSFCWLFSFSTLSGLCAGPADWPRQLLLPRLRPAPVSGGRNDTCSATNQAQQQPTIQQDLKQFF
ncbi:hypothetical protein BDW69DRAFT_172037 [Aspergillus filifer]